MSKALLPKLPTFGDICDMDIKIEWAVDKLIPKSAITILHGRGGVGKTWLMLQMGSCVADERPFAGLSTLKMPCYYIDFENSLATLHHRATVLGKSSLRIWHESHSIPPPRLDSKEWVRYKSLPPGLIIVDTLRACQSLEESSSKHMSFLMARLKMLRNRNFSIVLIHHSPKGNDQTYKGSTAIVDQCDHVLSLDRVNGGGQEIDGEDWKLPLRLGVRGKTRYEPFSIYLKFDPSKGFEKAEDPPDPDEESLKVILGLIVRFKKAKKRTPNQSDLAIKVKDHGMNKKRLLRLLKKGEGRYWSLIADPHSKARLYDPIIPKDD